MSKYRNKKHEKDNTTHEGIHWIFNLLLPKKNLQFLVTPICC